MRIALFFLLMVGSCAAQTLSGIKSTGITLGTETSASSFGTLTQYNAACSTGTTCNVTSVTLAAGDAAIISAFAPNSGISITSVTGQTCNRTHAWAFSAFNGSSDQCVITSASAISGASLTVNFSATTGGAIVNVRRYPVNGGTPPSVDAINSYTQGSSSSITCCVLALSGTNAAVAAGVGTGATAVSSPWTDTTSQSGSGLAAFTADQINVSSVATPTWTGSGMYGVADSALSFNPATSVPYALMDSSGGTGSIEPTASTLLSSLFGAAYSGTSNVNVSYTVTDNVGGLITYKGITGDACTNAYQSLFGPAPRFQVSGLVYPNASSLGIAFAMNGSNSTNTNILFNLPGADDYFNLESPTVGMYIDFCTTVASTDNTGGGIHTFTISSSGNDGPNLSFAATGSSVFFECESGAVGSCLNGLNSGVASTVAISPGTHYKLSFQFNGGAASQSPTSPSSLSIGSNTVAMPSGCFPNPNGAVYIGGTGTGEFAIPTCSSGSLTFTLVGAHSSGYIIQPAYVATVMDNSANVLGSFYYAGSTSPSYAYGMRIGVPGVGTGPNGKAAYFANWAKCYATISPAVCPVSETP